MTTWLPVGTPKHAVLLWGVANRAALLAADLRARLRDLGAVRLQVGLDDADVAPAMRIPSGITPEGVADRESISAVVFTWGLTDVAAGSAVEALSAASGAAGAGYRVEERRRLDPPETYDGERADALANVAVLRRPAELDHDTWLQRWMVEHTGVAIRTQATSGYLQHVVLEAVTPDAPRVDAIVEELFPAAGMVDPHAFHGSGGDDAELGRRLTDLMASVARIGADRDLDLVPTSRRLWDL